MTVSAEIKSCVANDWTLVASGAASAMGFKVNALADSLRLMPTASNTKPAALSASSPAWPVSSGEDNNYASDSATYWWLWNPNATAIELVVWKL
jgi:hypothetical protein